jgi:hypothetical protein
VAAKKEVETSAGGNLSSKGNTGCADMTQRSVVCYEQLRTVWQAERQEAVDWLMNFPADDDLCAMSQWSLVALTSN